MSFALSVSTEGAIGTPLHLISSQQYDTWYGSQDAVVQRWLLHVQFNGHGMAVIPSNDGHILKVIYVCQDLTHYFCLGNLSSQLPKGDYCLASEHSTDELNAILFSWGIASYRFDRYKKVNHCKSRLLIEDQAALDQACHLLEACKITRDLINTPAVDMMPRHLSAQIKTLAEQFNGQFSEVVGDDLLTQNYPMIHAVGRASDEAPRFIQLTWGDPSHPHLTLIGKGICFDSGGLNIKPGDSMRYMKKDMGGAAHAIGLAHLIMAHQLPVRLTLMVAAAENAISGNAFRPGDVLNTRKGLTVEIDNTDAEGRLVLCDALTAAADDKPDLMIDFATLTGACRVALGTELPGFFTRDREIAYQLMDAGEQTSDPVWHLPLHNAYKDYLHSEVADLVNSVPGPFGGAITAALYLEQFVDDCNWIHYDLMAWNRRALPGRPVGGEAMGLRATFAMLEKRYTQTSV